MQLRHVFVYIICNVNHFGSSFLRVRPVVAHRSNMFFAPYRKPAHAVDAADWNATISSLFGIVQRVMVRPSIANVLEELPCLTGIDLCLAIVFLKRSYDAGALMGATSLSPTAVRRFQMLKLKLNMEERVLQAEALSFRTPPLTVAEVCFFLAIGVKQELLCVGKSMPRHAVCLKTARGWQDVFTLSKFYKPVPHLRSGSIASHPLDTLDDFHIRRKGHDKAIGTNIVHYPHNDYTSSKKRFACNEQSGPRSKRSRSIDNMDYDDCYCPLLRESVLQVYISRDEHQRVFRLVKFPQDDKYIHISNHCLVFNYELMRVLSIERSSMVLATDQSIAPFLTAYARIHYICYNSILADASDASFKQMK